MSDRPVILITGCNRGLGLEFVAQYAARDWRVIATARNLDDAAELLALAAKYPNVSVESLDVGDGASIDAAAARHAGTAIDVLLNNAGLLGDREKQAFDVLDYSTFEEVMRVNTYGPLAMAKTFLPHVLAGAQKKIVTITSGLSSITNTRQVGRLFFYRISKAGVNMAMRVMQAELRERGIKVGILAPGMVDTRLFRQGGGGMPAAVSATQSVAAVMKHIDELTQDAEIILYTGEKVPW